MTTYLLSLLLFAAPDSAKLTVVSNTTEILQFDNLLLVNLLENHSLSAVRLFGETESIGGWIRNEIQDRNGKWIKVKPTVDQLGFFCGEKGECWLDGKSVFAECAGIHRRSLKGAFLFDTPGIYKIRAVATMPWGEVPSEPVIITVLKRPSSDLEKIESVPPKDLSVLARPILDATLPDSLLEMKSVGGNIARTIEQWEMTQTACKGGEWKGTEIPKEKDCEWLRDHLDSAALLHALEHSGSYYRETKNWDGLSRVVLSMKYDSLKRRAFAKQLERLVNPPIQIMP